MPRRRAARALVAALLLLGTVAAAGPAAAADGDVEVTPDSCVFLMRGDPMPVRVEVRNRTTQDYGPLTLVPRLPEGYGAVVSPAEPAPLRAGRYRVFEVTLTPPATAPTGTPTSLRFDAVAPGLTATGTLEVQLVDAPDAPTGVVATPGDGTATVTWQPGAPNRFGEPDRDEPRPRLFWVTATPGGARAVVVGPGPTTATVAGLANGTAYTFTVTERTDFGETTSAPSAPVVPAGPPRAVTGVTATGSGSTRTVSWQPADANGSPVTGYTVTAHPGGTTVAAAAGATSAEVTGLDPAVDHAFTVRATNAVGAGPDSVRPGGPPGAFAGSVHVQDDHGAVSVAVDDRTPGLEGWLVTVQPAGVEEFVPVSGYQVVHVLDVPADTTVAVTVRAVNAAGTGPAGPPTVIRTTGASTGVPYLLQDFQVAGPDSAHLCFLGVWGRGHDVTGYAVVDADGRERARVTPDVRHVTVPGLTDWDDYRFTVRVLSTARFDAYHTADLTVFPDRRAAAPAEVAATAGDGTVTVTWRDGQPGYPTTDVEVVLAPGGRRVYVPDDAGTVTLPGLTNGTAYTATVRAVTPLGYLAPVVLENLVPAGRPGPVDGVSVAPVAGDPTRATVSWGAAPANGSRVTSYAVLRGDAVVATTDGDATSAVVGGLAPGGSYTFSVRATNDLGPGDPVAAAPYTPDVTAPAVTVAPPPPVTTSGTAGVAYAAPDAVSYDVRYRVARYDGGFGAYRHPAGWQRTVATAVSGPVRGGWTYCYGVRARDAAGNVSRWSADTCTTAPLDDVWLTASGPWSRGTSARHYAGTYTATTTAGATLTRTGVRARRLALVATRCPTCGDVGVYLNGALVKRVRLTAPVHSWRNVVTIDLGAPRTGTVTVKALSGRAYVDGLGVLPF